LTLFFLASLVPAILLMTNRLWISLGHSLVVIAFGCVLLVVQVGRSLNSPIHFLNFSFLRYLGLRCYSIYLFHIFFSLVARAITDDFYTCIIIESILILLFAHLAWKYIETPLIRFGQKFSYVNRSG
jgi:peptidoglycan/LPS O-acetylase OafA/YrhL